MADGATCDICAAATLGLLPRLRVCPSARGITITKARLSKNAPRRRYVLTVVGCLFILDCSFNFLFTFFQFSPRNPSSVYSPWESNPRVNAPVLVKSAEGCQAFFLLFFHFFWFRSFRLFPASNAVEKDLNCGCDKWRSKETKKTALEREFTIAIREADSSPRRKANPPMQCAP